MTVVLDTCIIVFFSQMGQQHLQQETKNSAAAGKEKGQMTQRYVKGIIKYLSLVSSYLLTKRKQINYM